MKLVKEFTRDKSKLPRFVFLMCHGSNGYMLKDKDDAEYNYQNVIVEHFRSNNAPHLVEVLKLLVIQACR